MYYVCIVLRVNFILVIRLLFLWIWINGITDHCYNIWSSDKN